MIHLNIYKTLILNTVYRTGDNTLLNVLSNIWKQTTFNLFKPSENTDNLKFFSNKSKFDTELEKDVIGFEDNVLQTFLQYSWPGNLREFRNVVRRAVLLTPPGEKINLSSLPWEINNIEPLHAHSQDKKPSQIISSSPKKELDLKDAASRAEYETIMAVLQQVNFNKKKAAEVLNIDRKTLYNKIKNFQE